MINRSLIVEHCRLEDEDVEGIFYVLIDRGFLPTEVEKAVRNLFRDKVKLSLSTDWVRVLCQEFTLEDLLLLADHPPCLEIKDRALGFIGNLPIIKDLLNKRVAQLINLPFEIHWDKETESISRALLLSFLYLNLEE